MDRFIKGCECSNIQNFAIAEKKTMEKLFKYAEQYALADRYFQPSSGASSQNNMYFAKANFLFKDNKQVPLGSVGSNCYLSSDKIKNFELYHDPSITSLLAKCGFTLRTYAEGYDVAKNNFFENPCYPNGYDSSDIPFNYFAGIKDETQYISDYNKFMEDIDNNTLPEVSFIKPLGINTGHPELSTITEEIEFIEKTVEKVLNSDYYDDTLILWVPDESGGYYDHVSPPETNEIDDVPYGPRVPMMAFGKFAKKNHISHVTMEHSSIVKFIEWNWLNGESGHLNARDKNVNSIDDLINLNS